MNLNNLPIFKVGFKNSVVFYFINFQTSNSQNGVTNRNVALGL
jgi:hypothetical protein